MKDSQPESRCKRGTTSPESQPNLPLSGTATTESLKEGVRGFLPDNIREVIARRLHNTYCTIIEEMAATEEEFRNVKDSPSMRPWEFLLEDFKDSARAHAEDIPRKLQLISCSLAPAPMNENQGIKSKFEPEELELLAEVEHDRWNAERLQKQWCLGERNERFKTTPFLVPWKDLPEKWQHVDREMVRSYFEILPDQYRIYRVENAVNK